MSKKDSTTVVEAPKPSVKLQQLFVAVIDAQVNERADWEAIATEAGIAIVVNGKKDESPSAKTICAAQFVEVYAAKNAPNSSKESAEYKDAVKNGRAHFSTCINRALQRMGHRPVKARGAGGSTNAGQSNGAAQQNGQPNAAAVEFSAAVMSLIHESKRQAVGVVEALVAFAAGTKLTKAQAESVKALSARAEQVVEAIDAVSAALVAGKVEDKTDPVTAVEAALLVAQKAAQGNGATVQ